LLMSPTMRQSSRRLASAPVWHSCPSTCPGGACETVKPSRFPSGPDSPPPPESTPKTRYRITPTTPSPPPPTVSPPPGRPSIGPLPRTSSTCDGSSRAVFRKRTIGAPILSAPESPPEQPSDRGRARPVRVRPGPRHPELLADTTVVDLVLLLRRA